MVLPSLQVFCSHCRSSQKPSSMLLVMGQYATADTLLLLSPQLLTGSPSIKAASSSSGQGAGRIDAAVGCSCSSPNLAFSGCISLHWTNSAVGRGSSLLVGQHATVGCSPLVVGQLAAVSRRLLLMGQHIVVVGSSLLVW